VTSTFLWSEKAILVRALIGSPCEPVVIITTWFGLYFFMLSILISTPSGTFIYPRRIDISTIFSILLPETATLRPFLAAASIICCTLCTFDAKVATIIRLLQPLKICSNFSPTLLSLIAYPGRSTFVLSERTARTPSFPSSPSLARSIISPTIGVVSILKSPI